MPKAILQKEAPVLRQVAERVPVKDIPTPKIQKILKEMFEALKTQEDGAAIAAPQIGYSLRIFVIAESLFGTEEGAKFKSGDRHLVYINPEIVKRSKVRELMDEGCLSVRGFYGTVKRNSRTTVKAYDEHGSAFERGASGLLSQVFQHEIDHLEGILFIDRAHEVWEVSREKKTA